MAFLFLLKLNMDVNIHIAGKKCKLKSPAMNA